MIYSVWLCEKLYHCNKVSILYSFNSFIGSYELNPIVDHL